MSERFPRVTGKDLVRALKKLGFLEDRVRGSHVIMMDGEGQRIASVPVHAGRSLPIGTLRGILDDLEVSVDELRAKL